MVEDLCEAYYLPVCQRRRPSSESKIIYNNPNCLLSAIQSGRSTIDSHCLCGVNHPLTIPGLQILFDFSSTAQFTVNVGSQKTIMITDHCNKHRVYDPFSRSCRDLAPVPEAMIARKTYMNTSPLYQTAYTCHLQMRRLSSFRMKVFTSNLTIVYIRKTFTLPLETELYFAPIFRKTTQKLIKSLKMIKKVSIPWPFASSCTWEVLYQSSV